MSARPPLTVLFEDQLGAVKEFGPSNLLSACVADLLGADLYSIRGRINAIPCKGDSKMLGRCESEARNFSSGAYALFDFDRFDRLLGLPPKVECSDRREEWAKRCPGWPSNAVVLLDRNTETLVALAADLMSRPLPRKDRAARDAMLNAVAMSPEHASKRAALLERSPSFALLVRRVADHLRPAPTAP